MPTVTRRGHRVHYSVEGTGPTVVLLHGLLMADGWLAGGIAPALAADYRVVCIDSLGEGQSDKPDNPSLYLQRERTADVRFPPFADVEGDRFPAWRPTSAIGANA